MEAIKWQRGKYLKFYAKMKLRIGGSDTKVNVIYEGDEFLYDGSILKYAGEELVAQGLRGAIAQGWASQTQDDATPIGAIVPSRNMAKAASVNRDLNKVQRTRTVLEVDSLDEDTVLEVSDRGKTEKNSGTGQNPKLLTQKDNRRGTPIIMSEADSQSGVTVGKVRSAAKVNVDVLKHPNLASEIENRELGKPIMSKKVIRTEGIEITTNANVDRGHVSVGDDNDGVVVGKTRHSDMISTEGIHVKDTSSKKSTGDSKPVTAVKKSTRDEKLSPRVRIARRIDPEFPVDWCFSGKLVDRLAATKAHGVSPQFLEALYAAEGDQMRKILEKEFPKHFR